MRFVSTNKRHIQLDTHRRYVETQARSLENKQLLYLSQNSIAKPKRMVLYFLLLSVDWFKCIKYVQPLLTN